MESEKPTVEELKAKAYQPMEDAIKLHPFHGGKIDTALKCRIPDFQDFGIWYTPGTVWPCRGGGYVVESENAALLAQEGER